MILDFPYIRQNQRLSSGLACAHGILHYYGFDKVKENDLLSFFILKEIKSNDIENLFKKFSLEPVIKKSTIDEVIQNISQEIPVIINLQAGSNSNIDYTKSYDHGHYAVAIGFKEDKIIFSDPSCMYRTYLSLEEMDRRWHDKISDSEYTDHLAIFINNKKPNFTNKKIKEME